MVTEKEDHTKKIKMTPRMESNEIKKKKGRENQCNMRFGVPHAITPRMAQISIDAILQPYNGWDVGHLVPRPTTTKAC